MRIMKFANEKAKEVPNSSFNGWERLTKLVFIQKLLGE
jgi:hypothetical protein